MHEASTQRLLVIKARNLAGVAQQLERQLASLPGARVVTMVVDANRLTSFRGRVTVLAVVSTDS